MIEIKTVIADKEEEGGLVYYQPRVRPFKAETEMPRSFDMQFLREPLTLAEVPFVFSGRLIPGKFILIGENLSLEGGSERIESLVGVEIPDYYQRGYAPILRVETEFLVRSVEDFRVLRNTDIFSVFGQKRTFSMRCNQYPNPEDKEERGFFLEPFGIRNNRSINSRGWNVLVVLPYNTTLPGKLSFKFGLSNRC